MAETTPVPSLEGLRALSEGGCIPDAAMTAYLDVFATHLTEHPGRAGCDALNRAALAAFLRSLLATPSSLTASEGGGSGADQGWRPMASAPRDGTKIDLLYPYPRGRTIDCFWAEGGIFGSDGNWVRRSPRWNGLDLLPEEQWDASCYMNVEPLAWMPAPPLPAPPVPAPTGTATGEGR